MNTKIYRHLSIVLMALLLGSGIARAQFAGCSTGLLQIPTADMQEDGTFMITNNFLNKHSLPSKGWNYNTFQYGIGISLWGRVEISYVCTIFNGAWDPRPHEEIDYREVIMRNQDRHFIARICLLREEEFGLKWVPALVIGVSDPTTGGTTDYTNQRDVSGIDNCFFNRNYIVLSKHFPTRYGSLGAHLGYQFNRRRDYPIDGPCLGLNWSPIWLQQRGILDQLEVIAEYDSRTVNLGFIASIWGNRFEAMFELQNFQWINFGLRYKLKLRKINQ